MPQATFADWLRQMEHQRQTLLQQQRGVGGPAIPVTMANNHVMYPAPTYQLNYMMPPYLTAPEMRMPGETLGSVLVREVLRAVFKALGHALANFFDSRPWREPPPPPMPPAAPPNAQ